jgi:uncharacterized protein (TIGR02147 family)
MCPDIYNSGQFVPSPFAFRKHSRYEKPMKLTIKNLLMEELTLRQTRNSSYSLRAFARDLGIGATTLSDVLADKRSLSKTNLHKVMERMALSPAEREKLWENYKLNVSRSHEVDDRTTLDEDTFRLIADWYYLAILNLAKLNECQSAPDWIAARLGLKEEEVNEALERLFRLDLVRKNRNRLVRTSKPLTTSNDVPSAAIRKHHTQNLRLAEESMNRDPVGTREISSITMPVNPEKLQHAKELLLKTRKKIAALLEDDNASEVYTLSFQLFPLTKLQTPTEDNT